MHSPSPPTIDPTTGMGIAGGAIGLLIAQVQAAPWWGSVLIVLITIIPAILQYLERRADWIARGKRPKP